MKSQKTPIQQIASDIVKIAIETYNQKYESNIEGINAEHFPVVFSTILRYIAQKLNSKAGSFNSQLKEIADVLEKIRVTRDKKNINLFIYPDNKVLISEWENTTPEAIGDSDIILINPFHIHYNDTNLLMEDNQVNYTLTPWMYSYSNQRKFYIHSDKILTMAEPNNSLLEQYKKLLE